MTERPSLYGNNFYCVIEGWIDPNTLNTEAQRKYKIAQQDPAFRSFIDDPTNNDLKERGKKFVADMQFYYHQFLLLHQLIEAKSGISTLTVESEEVRTLFHKLCKNWNTFLAEIDTRMQENGIETTVFKV